MHSRQCPVLALLSVLCCVGFGLGGPAHATTRTVTKLADTNDGVCNADCSLREAIGASAASDTINFSVSGAIGLTLGELNIGRNLTINGPSGGVAIERASGAANFRIFNVSAGTVRLANLSISHGAIVGSAGADGTSDLQPGGNGGPASGGGILNQGNLTLINCTVHDNAATGGHGGYSIGGLGGSGGSGSGGGIANAGTLTLTNCTLSGNAATGGTGGTGDYGGLGGLGGNGSGGGIANAGTLTQTNCTLSGNEATGGTGGSGQSSGGNGGSGIGGGLSSVAPGTSSIRNATVALNNATGGPGGTSFGSSGADGAAQGLDVFGAVSSLGHNLIGATDDSSGWVASDFTGTAVARLNPQLLPLSDNGGPTPTMALSSGSVAIDTGDDAVLSSPDSLTTDQRGLPRKLGAHVDIGAFEFDPPQSGATFVVSTTHEHNDGTCGVDCTLIEALEAANADSNANTITFKAGVSGTLITTQTNGLSVNNPVTIQGPGASVLAISGAAARRVFVVSASGSVSISGLTITAGTADASSFSGNGGGLIHLGSGPLSLTNCVFFANSASNYGGAIYQGGTGTLSLAGCTFMDNAAIFGGGLLNAVGAGTATLTACAFTNNAAPSGGGAINNGSTVNATNCTFSGNTANSGGGGALNMVGTTTLSGCTLSGNTAQNGGGGIYSYTDLTGHTTTLRNCTLSGNSSPVGGGALYNVVGLTVLDSCTLTHNTNTAPGGSGSGAASSGDAQTRTEVGNSIIAGNTNWDVDFVNGNTNSFKSNDYNLIGTGTGTSEFTGANHDQLGLTAAQLKLGPLQDNGGSTQTHALLVGSPAIDAGNTSLTTDQRGLARPYNDPSVPNATGGDGSDIGAYERQAPTLSINDVSLTEGDAGTKNLLFTVTLRDGLNQTVTVGYATQNGTATAGADYTATSGTLTFTAGQTFKAITVPVAGDTLDEPNEIFKVNLSSPANAALSDAVGVGTIIDNDATPHFLISDATVTEGNSGTVNAVFTLSLSAASGRTVTVTYKTADGTATAGADYVAIPSTTLTFTPGQTSKTITVLVKGDTADEAIETFKVVLQSATFAAIVDDKGVGTITDDDPLPSLSIRDAPALNEGNAGTHNALFTVTLIGATNRTVTVNYATANGTATAGSDYTVATGTITFTPGQTSKTLPVQVLGDATVEPDESFKVNLTGASFATIADGQGVHTILDDDGASE